MISLVLYIVYEISCFTKCQPYIICPFSFNIVGMRGKNGREIVFFSISQSNKTCIYI